MVSGNYFNALQLQPAVGRFFSREEQSETPGAQTAVVLGHRFWEQRFEGRTSVIGQKIRLNKQEFTVIGVAPRGFSGTIGGLQFDVYVPLMMTAALTGNGRWLDDRGSRPLYLMARLRDGVTLQQAREEARSIASSLAEQYPEDSKGHSTTLLAIADATRGAQAVLGTPLRMLIGVAAVVLLIVCANVANLQLARAVARRKEIGVRHALGAGRARVATLLLTESLALAFAGGAAGAMLSLWTVDLLRLLFPQQYLPIHLTFRADWAVLSFVALLCVLTAVLAGLAPAMQLGRNLNMALLSSGRSPASVTASGRMRNSLVVSEIALAMVALVCAGMLYRSFDKARHANPGFDPHGVLLAGLNLSAGGYDREQGLTFFTRVKERLSALPGVESVAFAEDVPLGFDGGSWEELAVDGYVPGPSENMKIYRNLVSPGYLNLMRIPLRAGRDFTERDDRQAPLVVIVNESFVRRFFAGREALGRKIRGWGRELLVVGVAADSKYTNLTESAKPYMYLPLGQFYRTDTGVAVQVRTAGDVGALLQTVRGEIHALDGAVLSSVVVPLTEYMSASYVVQQTAAMVLAVLGAVGLAVAVFGLFSLMTYSVTQRIAEMGIRLALGASPISIVRMVISQGMRLAAAGVALGFVASLAAGRAVEGLLYGVLPVDAVSLLGAGTLLTAVAALAAFLPARRAANVDPMVALRHE